MTGLVKGILIVPATNILPKTWAPSLDGDDDEEDYDDADDDEDDDVADDEDEGGDENDEDVLLFLFSIQVTLLAFDK